jgi:hypothetical protein
VRNRAVGRSHERQALLQLRHETLVPVLRPGDVVVMDNLPAHKVAGVQAAIEAAGARVLYLPS